MAEIGDALRGIVARILEGEGRASRADRRAAFDNQGLRGAVAVLVQKVAKRAHQVTDEDVSAVRESGLSEDQIFEIVISAAIGQAKRQYDTAVAALASASTKE
jgi:hypothetical protein